MTREAPNKHPVESEDDFLAVVEEFHRDRALDESHEDTIRLRHLQSKNKAAMDRGSFAQNKTLAG